MTEPVADRDSPVEPSFAVTVTAYVPGTAFCGTGTDTQRPAGGGSVLIPEGEAGRTRVTPRW